MVSEVLLGGFSIAAVAVQSQLAATAEQERRAGRFVDEEQQQSQQSSWGYARTISFWGFAGLALGGVLQANLEYVPEFRETRKRRLPPELEAPPPARKAASVMYVPYADQHGAGLNVVGSF
jgi:hypothetical protein